MPQMSSTYIVTSPVRATQAVASVKFVRISVVKSRATDLVKSRATDRDETLFADVKPEPSSAAVISPADAVRRYWRWDTMPETMRRLA